MHGDLPRRPLEKGKGLPRTPCEWYPPRPCIAAALAGTSPSLGGNGNGFTEEMMAQLDGPDKEIERRATDTAVYQDSMHQGNELERPCAAVQWHTAPRDCERGGDSR